MATLAYPYFTGEHELFRKSIGAFCRKEIAPHALEWEQAHAHPKELFAKAGELGLFGIRVDPEWGGSGMDWWASAAAYDALQYTDFPSLNLGLMVQMDLTVPVLEKLGTTEQKQEFLQPAVTGEKLTALAISEPDCGSDVAAMRTRATLEGGDWVVRGQKLWITNGSMADFLVLAVRTAEDRHHGVSLLLFPTDTPGFSASGRISKVGNVASDTAHLYFDECRVPSRYVLGEVNHGFQAVMQNFEGERLATTLLVLSFMDRALDLSMQYARERKAFGRPLMENQVWRHRFAEHRAQVEAARWLTYRALDVLNHAGKAPQEIAMAKLVACDLAQKVLYDCTQVFGGFGYTVEYPVARMWRDLRLFTIGAGTSEIMKEIIAKEGRFLGSSPRR